MIAASSGDDSTLGTLPLGWSLLVGLAIVAVLVVCVVRILRERHRDKLAQAWDEGWNASADYMARDYVGPDDPPNPYEPADG